MKKLFLSAAALAAFLAAPGAMAGDQQNAPNDQTQNGDRAGPRPDAEHGSGDMMQDGPHAGGTDRDTVPADAPPKSIVRSNERVDVTKLRANVQAAHRFHNGAYRGPVGWAPRHWMYGESLPREYFARDYWLGDFRQFGLMVPPDGYEWVRVGDDALLVNVETGEVIRVEYAAFY